MVKDNIHSVVSEQSEDKPLPLDATNIADHTIKHQIEQVQQSTTQKSLALSAIAQKKVFLCPESQSFVVEGSKGDKYAVTLAPKEECQCPSIGTCYHIIAARMSVGLEAKSEKTVYNLTQLRKNSRKRPDKYAGKKKPRPIDRLDVINESVIVPAPDSILQNPDFDSNIECSTQFASTPTHAKRVNDRNTPKSILKRKLDSEIQSANKRLRLSENCKSKKLKLSLPKTRRRKSLLKSFSDISNDQRLGNSEGIEMTEQSPLQEKATVVKEIIQNECVKQLYNFG